PLLRLAERDVAGPAPRHEQRRIREIAGDHPAGEGRVPGRLGTGGHAAVPPVSRLRKARVERAQVGATAAEDRGRLGLVRAGGARAAVPGLEPEAPAELAR